MRFFPIIFLFLLSLFVTNASASEPYATTEDASVIGIVQSYQIKGKESLIEVARSFNLGYNEIIAANPGLDPFVPGEGTEVAIPTSWILPDNVSYKGIVVNISEMRLYYFIHAQGALQVRTYPIGIGDEGNDTPVGNFRIIEKIANPAWHVPKSIKEERPFLPDVIPPGPDNPLGTHALRLSLGSYLIHGTNRPWAVGRRVTHGCIRLYPEDIPRVFDLVPNGTAVDIVRQPVKVGKRDGKVYLEVHQDDQESFNYLNEAVSLLRKQGVMDKVNPEKLYLAVMRKSGVPVVVSGQ